MTRINEVDEENDVSRVNDKSERVRPSQDWYMDEEIVSEIRNPSDTPKPSKDAKDHGAEVAVPRKTRELRYEIGSPHADFDLYLKLEKADRRAELSQAAATADSLSEAAATLLSAIDEVGSGESKYEQGMREVFEREHGREPTRMLVRTEIVEEPTLESGAQPNANEDPRQ